MMIRNRRALDEMTTPRPYTGVIKTAPCAILVMGDQKATDLDEYLYCGYSAAVQDVLIEVRHQGLSTCWCAVGPRKEHMNNSHNCYKLKEDLLSVAVIAVGYGCEGKKIAGRFDLDKVSYFD